MQFAVGMDVGNRFWEISYCLKKISRDGRTSHRNGLVGVIMKVNGGYDWFKYSHNNAEACNGISKADFKSKSFIALKEARESLYWIELLHRNNFIDDRQYESIYGDCEELVKVLHHRCKKINDTE